MTRAMGTLLLLGLAGCATVRPWQRERLTARCMATDEPTSPAMYDAHVRAVRIGDVVAAGAGGGGCGCN